MMMEAVKSTHKLFIFASISALVFLNASRFALEITCSRRMAQSASYFFIRMMILIRSYVLTLCSDQLIE